MVLQYFQLPYPAISPDNCTDKAISRWETGKGFPDIVFLAPLAKTLGVTVNELLAGERLSQEELVTKSDEVIISTMQEAENDKKKAKKKAPEKVPLIPLKRLLRTVK